MIRSNTPATVATTEATATPGVLQRARVALRHLTPDRDGQRALILIACGVLIRLGLLLLDWPRTDSDEGTMGLMAIHIATRGEHPLFFYGQTYMGTIQAHLGAAFFALFGASVLTLRLGLLLLFTLFLATMYILIRLLYDPGFALLTLVLLDLGGPELLRPQLLALGGYPELLLFGALGLLLAIWLAQNARVIAPGRQRWLRLAAYAGCGVTLGAGWWSDPAVLPFLVVAVLPLLVFCRRDLLRGGLAVAVAGLVIGLLPQIIYNITNTGQGGPSAMAAFQPQGVGTLAQLPARFGAHLSGTLFISLPDITGADWLCTVPVDRAGLPVISSGVGALACAGMRAGWSLGLFGLAIAAAIAAIHALRASRMLAQFKGWQPEERRTAVRQFGRLMLLLGAGLTVAMYIVSPAAVPPGHARYLIGMAIALPAIIYPLWNAGRLPARLDVFGSRRSWIHWLSTYRVFVGLFILVLAGGVVATYRSAPAAHAQYAADQQLVRDLERLGIQHMYTDYWTCYKVAFISHERITCDILGATLAQGNNRYPPYVAAVQADPRASYAFPANSPQAAALARRASDPAWHATQVTVDGYVIYLPGQTG